MDKESTDAQASITTQAAAGQPVDGLSTAASDTTTDESVQDGPSRLSATGISLWARSLKIPQALSSPQDESSTGDGAKSTFARFTSGIGLRLSPKSPPANDIVPAEALSPQPGLLGTITKGFLDSSKNAVKAVQVKARHAVSQNKRRYQEGEFDLDMTYITENIIAMGFPAGDMSSGFFGYVEGFYRNHMEEVIKFFETHHKGKYKVYNLCSERLYDASLFEGKVACFPFDDHNCPPIQLITSFCQSAYSWLKEDIENVVVVHCKAGMARTGLMISSLLLYLKFFPTAEESMNYYNQKRCIDAKGLVLPSQIRYVKYFESILTYFNGENQPGRRCMLRGFRLHKCPYWIRPAITISDHNGVLFSTKKHPRTKDLSPEDFWFSAPKKGIMVFALPGEPGLSELCGDFKVQFHDRQGDFYCWLNTTFMENRKILNTAELDGFEKRKLPSPGFQVEIVLADYDGSKTTNAAKNQTAAGSPQTAPETDGNSAAATEKIKVESSDSNNDKDDVFSDDEGGGGGGSSNKSPEAPPATTTTTTTTSAASHHTNNDNNNNQNHPTPGGGGGSVDKMTEATQKLSIENSGGGAKKSEAVSSSSSSSKAGTAELTTPDSQFKAMAADASVFTFGDEDDYESD